jgi:integrase
MLTDTKIKAAIAKAVAEKRPIAVLDAGKTPGLELRANPGGTASWAFLYRPPGEKNRHRFPLGLYSSENGIAKARRAAAELRTKRTAGIDPLAERNQRVADQLAAEAARKAKEAADAARITVAKLVELFLAAKADLAWAKRYRQMLEFNVIPLLGTRIAATITRADVQQVVDAVCARGAKVQARRVFDVMHTMLLWGVGRDYVTGEPWKGVELPPAGEARTRVLTAEELRWVWDLSGRWIAGNSGGKPNQGRILRLLILTGQRSDEVGCIPRTELSDDRSVWTLPPERTKNKRQHAVPMPPLARAIVQEAIAAIPAGQKHLFVGERGAVARTDDLSHDLTEAIENYGIAHFTVHDLRRTVATGLEQMGIPMTVISATLNHVGDKGASVTRKHYAHADLSREVRGALSEWQAIVQRVIGGDDPFAVKAEDNDQIEARALAKGFGGAPHLRIVA